MKLTRIGSVLFFFVLSCPVFSQIEARLSRENIQLGQTLILEVVFQGPESSEVSDFPKVDRVQFQYRGESRNASVVIRNNRSTREISTSYRWEVFPERTGAFQIPSIEIISDGKSYYSKPLTFNVNEPGQLEGYEFKLESSQSFGFPGQPIEMRMKFYVSGSVANLRFTLPFMQDNRMRIEPIEPSASSQDVRVLTIYNKEFYGTLGSERFHEEQFTTLTIPFYLIPEQEGLFTLDPCLLSFDEEVGRDSFLRSRYESRSLQSNSLELMVDSLPAEITESYNGTWISKGPLIGSLSVDPTKLRLGDPVTIELSLSGLVHSEKMTIPDISEFFQNMTGFQFAAEPMEQESNNNGRTILRRKLRLASSDVYEIPAQRFPYFNLDTQKVEYLDIPSVPLEITGSDMVDVEQVEILGTNADAIEQRTNNENPLRLAVMYTPDEVYKQYNELRLSSAAPYYPWLIIIPLGAILYILLSTSPWKKWKKSKQRYPWEMPESAESIISNFSLWAQSEKGIKEEQIREICNRWEGQYYGGELSLEELNKEMEAIASRWEQIK